MDEIPWEVRVRVLREWADAIEHQDIGYAVQAAKLARTMATLTEALETGKPPWECGDPPLVAEPAEEN